MIRALILCLMACQQANAQVRSVPLSLKELAIKSDKIFVGQIKSVTTHHKLYSYVEITISVSTALVGVKPNSDIVITQHVLASSEVKPGDEILWFLPKPSKLGFCTPLGFHAGHFEIDGKLAVNRLNNHGLWKSREQISTVSQQYTLSRVLKSQDALAIATREFVAGPLPLELVVAMTKIYLAQK